MVVCWVVEEEKIKNTFFFSFFFKTIIWVVDKQKIKQYGMQDRGIWVPDIHSLFFPNIHPTLKVIGQVTPMRPTV
jgi:hypothetical protein